MIVVPSETEFRYVCNGNIIKNKNKIPFLGSYKNDPNDIYLMVQTCFYDWGLILTTENLMFLSQNQDFQQL